MVSVIELITRGVQVVKGLQMWRRDSASAFLYNPRDRYPNLKHRSTLGQMSFCWGFLS